MSNNLFLQLLQRVFADNPKFFKVIQWVSITIAAISFLFDFLTETGVQIPNWLVWLNTTAIKVGAITAIIMAQLPNKDINQNNETHQ